MAQTLPRVQQDIERQLELSLWQWRRLPAVEAEIDGWDLLDQLHFTEEWPLEEERLLHLERYAAAGEMTGDQRARYDKLTGLVKQSRPVIQRLLAS